MASALLLSACGGSSSSSGDNKTPIKPSNPSQPSATAQEINATPTSKLNALSNAYWKSECQKRHDGTSKITYVYAIKQANGSLKFEKYHKQYFSDGQCTTKTKVVNKSDEVLTEKDMDDVTFQTKDKLVVVNGDGKETVHTRIEANQFPT